MLYGRQEVSGFSMPAAPGAWNSEVPASSSSHSPIGAKGKLNRNERLDSDQAKEERKMDSMNKTFLNVLKRNNTLGGFQI